MSNFAGKTCPCCNQVLNEKDSVIFCSQCCTPHHRNCMEKNGGCAVPGCKGSSVGINLIKNVSEPKQAADNSTESAGNQKKKISLSKQEPASAVGNNASDAEKKSRPVAYAVASDDNTEGTEKNEKKQAYAVPVDSVSSGQNNTASAVSASAVPSGADNIPAAAAFTAQNAETQQQYAQGQPQPQPQPQGVTYNYVATQPKKNNSIIVVILLVILFILIGAGTVLFFLLNPSIICRHEWSPASCEDVSVCDKCGKTQGEALGHEWVDASCESAKECKRCGKTDGKANGHIWAAATCELPKTCTVCGKTEGVPAEHVFDDFSCEKPATCKICKKTFGNSVGHVWKDATCEAARTCSVCGKTEGEPLNHEWIQATCTSPKQCSRCKKTEGSASGHSWAAATFDMPMHCTECGVTEGSKLEYSYVGTGYVSVQSGGLNLRQSASTSSGVITLLSNGTALSLYDCGVPGWYYTSYNGSYGYVSSQYISFSRPSSSYGSYIGSGTVATVNAGLNLRKSATTNSDVICVIPSGTRLSLYRSYSSDWYLTYYNGNEGYVSAQYVSLD